MKDHSSTEETPNHGGLIRCRSETKDYGSNFELKRGRGTVRGDQPDFRLLKPTAKDHTPSKEFGRGKNFGLKE